MGCMNAVGSDPAPLFNRVGGWLRAGSCGAGAWEHPLFQKKDTAYIDPDLALDAVSRKLLNGFTLVIPSTVIAALF
jgi:hypothetical protein